MELQLDKLIGALQTGIETVIRGHFAGLDIPAPDNTNADLSDVLEAAEADLETILDRLKVALAPPAVDTPEADAGLATGADTHPEVTGQPAPQ